MIDPPMLNRHKFSAIAHRDHDYCNPISAAKIERLLDMLPLDASSRVLDLGCGRAELALRIIERFGARVLAIDNSSLMLDAARERAEWTGALGRLHLDNVDIAEFQADPETFHLTVMLGADAGLIPMHATTASRDEWDEYEWKYCRSIERYAREQPDDADVPQMLERIRHWRDAYLRWGRAKLGFAVYLFYRPGPTLG